MRLLFLSFYFQPDLCAGSFRATALAEALAARLGPADLVEVITTMPNRYRSFKVAAPVDEHQGSLRINRVALPAHRSGIADQSRAFGRYAREVWRRAAGQSYDLVFATSSRLMTAALGARVARRGGIPLYLDIRDIFTETMAGLFAGKPQGLVLPLLRRIERQTVCQAARINLVSEGFIDHFRTIRGDLEYRVFTNGIADQFLRFPCRERSGEGRKVILYAGNIGEGQGLHRVLPEAAQALADGYEFRVVGDGGARSRLEEALAAKGVGNVTLSPPVSGSHMIELYAGADVLFLHLNDFPALHKVVPSKLFEYAATGKPILAGAAGYTRRFIEEHVSNAALFTPCDPAGLVAALATLNLAPTPREQFKQLFARRPIIARLADDILELAG